MSLVKNSSELFTLFTNKQKRLFLAFIFLRSIITCFDILGLIMLSFYLARFVDNDLQPQTFELLHTNYWLNSNKTNLLMIICLFFFIKSVFALLILKYFSKFLEKVETDQAVDLFNIISTAKLDEVSKFTRSEINYGVTHSVTMTSSQWLSALAIFITEGVTLICYLVFLFSQNVLLTAVTVLYGVIFLGFISKQLRKQFRSASKLFDEGFKSATEITSEYSLNRRSISTINQKRSYTTSFRQRRDPLSKANTQFLFLASLPRYILELFVIFGAALIIFFKEHEYLNTTTYTQIGLFIVTLFRILGSLIPFLNSLLSIERINTESRSHFNLRECLTIKPRKVSDRKLDIEIKDYAIDMSIFQLTFQYSGAEDTCLVFDDAHIPFGSLVLISGPSGSGKSTFLDLIANLYPPSSGKIVYSRNGVQIETDLVEDEIAFLPQHPMIINGTILENITLVLGSTSFNEEKLAKAIEMSEIGNLIDGLPNGVFTVLRSHETNLSGGEIQRIALARIFYREPSIILLDEPTSALDVENETLIEKSIQSFRGNATVILSTHTLNLSIEPDIHIIMAK